MVDTSQNIEVSLTMMLHHIRPSRIAKRVEPFCGEILELDISSWLIQFNTDQLIRRCDANHFSKRWDQHLNWRADSGCDLSG